MDPNLAALVRLLARYAVEEYLSEEQQQRAEPVEPPPETKKETAP